VRSVVPLYSFLLITIGKSPANVRKKLFLINYLQENADGNYTLDVTGIVLGYTDGPS
jgi:hypothetical protein